jgi:hypothetical protein
MGGVRSESKLFHAIVVVGLSLASTECGSSVQVNANDAGGGSSPEGVADAAKDGASTTPGLTVNASGSTADAPALTIGVGDATATSGDGGLCGLDAASPDAKGCWPVYI